MTDPIDAADQPPPQPHDALFRWTFSQRRHAAGLLRAALPPAWVAQADFRTLHLENADFVNRALRRRHSDLVFSIRVRGKKVYFYVLVEHQRRVEPLMVVRMGIYVMRLYDEMLQDYPRLAEVPLDRAAPRVPRQDAMVGEDGVPGRGRHRRGRARRAVALLPPLRDARGRPLRALAFEPFAERADRGGKVVLAVLAAARDEARLRRVFAELGPGDRRGGQQGRTTRLPSRRFCGTLQRRTSA